MALLIELPDALWTSLFCNWLAIADFVRLDSAHCNRQARVNFLATAYGSEAILDLQIDHNGAYRMYDVLNTWIIVRSAKVSTLYVTAELVENANATRYFESRGQFITTIHFKWQSEQFYKLPSPFKFLQYCPNISVCTAEHQSAILQMVLTYPRLEEATLVGELSQATIDKLTGKLSNLRKLCITTSDFLPGRFLSTLGECSMLTDVLLFAYWKRVDPFTFTTLASCPNLTTLSLANVSVSGADLNTLSAHCKLLHTLRLDRESLQPSADVSLTPLLSIKILDLQNMKVPDNFMADLLRSCPALQELTLTACPGVRNLTLDSLGECTPNLQVLQVYPTGTYIDATFLVSIAAHCPSLRLVHTGWVVDVKPEHICALAEACPLLEDVLFHTCDATDAAISLMAQRCRKLRRLDLRGCRGLNKDVLAAVRESCPHITDFCCT
jgi:hypothetical protein